MLLLLAKADEQQAEWVLEIKPEDEFSCFFYRRLADYNKLIERNINFIQAARIWLRNSCRFEDLYGNLWDLLEPNEHNKESECKGESSFERNETTTGHSPQP
jgi:hypothetical protein